MPLTIARDGGRGGRGLGLALLLVLSLLAPTRSAIAETPTAQCASAYERAQILRQRGKLLAAREQAGVCAREQCPEVARRDCSRWAEELGRETPSVVVVVRDATDHDVPASRLLIDGAPRADLSSGRPIEVDPGAHVFRVEPAGAPPFEQSVTVYQGERDRIVRLALPGAPAVPAPALPPPAPAVKSAPPATSSDRPTYVSATVVGGLAVISLAASAYLGLTGRQQLSDLHSSCAPACTDSDVDPVRTRLVFSDVTLGIGVVGAALSTYLFVHTASERAALTRTTMGVAPTQGGAAAFIGARF